MSVEIMSSGTEDISASSVASRLKLFEQSGGGRSGSPNKPNISPRPGRANNLDINPKGSSKTDTTSQSAENDILKRADRSPKLSPKPSPRKVSPKPSPRCETPPKPFSAPASRQASQDSGDDLSTPSSLPASRTVSNAEGGAIKKPAVPQKKASNDGRAGLDLNANINKKPELPVKPGLKPVLPKKPLPSGPSNQEAKSPVTARKPLPSPVSRQEDKSPTQHWKRLSGPPQRPLPPGPASNSNTNSTDVNVVPKPPRGKSRTESNANRLEKCDSQRRKPPEVPSVPGHLIQEENNQYDAPEMLDEQNSNSIESNRPSSLRRPPPLPKGPPAQKSVTKPPPVPASRRPRTAEEQSIYSYAVERVIDIPHPANPQLDSTNSYESPSVEAVQGFMQAVNQKQNDSDDDYDTPDAGTINAFMDRMKQKGARNGADAGDDVYEAVDNEAVDAFRQSLKDKSMSTEDFDSGNETYCDPETLPVPNHLLGNKPLPKAPSEKPLPPSPTRHRDTDDSFDDSGSDDANDYDDPQDDWGVVQRARRGSHAVLNPDAYLALEDLDMNQTYQDPSEMFADKPDFVKDAEDADGFNDDLADEPLYQVYAADVLKHERQRSQRESDPDDDDLWSEYGSSRGSFQRPLWCHLPSVRGSGILDTIDTQERKRQEAMFEVITSEASYLKSLHIVVSHFMSAMLPVTNGPPEEQLLDRQQFHFIFGGLTSIKAISERFLHDLRQRQEENFIISSISDIIEEYGSKYFECYVKYCSNQVYQERTLSLLVSENPPFCELLGKLESSSKAQGLSLQSFLMLPMQRITRLPLLVDAICHRCEPGSEEFQRSDKALRAVNKVVKKCNEDARKMERIEEMYYIQQTLTFKMKPIALISSSRWLLRRGDITCLEAEGKHSKLRSQVKSQIKTLLRGGKEVQLYLFLFTDLLLIARKKSEETFKVLDYCSRSLLRVEEAELTNPEQRPTSPGVMTKYAFSLILLENHRSKTVEYLCFPQNETDKIRWLEALVPQRESQVDGEKVYEEWDCPQVQAVHNYHSAQPDELTLHEGDIVKVLRKLPDGWYEGMRLRDGEQGWFPANHTEEIHSEHARARNLMQRFRLINATKQYMNTMMKK